MKNIKNFIIFLSITIMLTCGFLGLFTGEINLRGDSGIGDVSMKEDPVGYFFSLILLIGTPLGYLFCLRRKKQ